MAPPRLGESQVNCGPYFLDREIAGRWISLATPRGDYDLQQVASRLPTEQQPDVVVVHVDGSSLAGTPKNLAAFRCPKVLLVADTHHGTSPISGIIKYALREQFDRVVLLYDRHHVDLFRGAGVRNLHWFPALTFPHSDHRIAAARMRERKTQIALVGTTGYHPRRLRAFAALVEKRLPLSWKQIHQSQAIGHYAESLIGLNISMNGDLNMRVFEVLAGGAMLLGDRLQASSGLQELLQEGREWVGYDSIPEMVERATYFLERPDEARVIAQAGARWFEENFSEKRRLEAFRGLAFDGLDHPAFSLPPARILFSGQLNIAATLPVYESAQLLHLHREEVKVVVDATVPSDLSALFETLPRVKVRQGNGSESCDLAVVTQTKGSLATRADRVWLWDANPDRSIAGMRRLTEQAAYWGRFVPESKNPLVEKAAAALQHGDVQTAFQCATAAIKNRPVPVHALFILTELSIEARNWTLARSLLGQARAIDPTHPQLVLLGRDIEQEVPSKQAFRFLTTARRAFDSKAVHQARGYAVSGLKADPHSAELLHLVGVIIAYVKNEGDFEGSLVKTAEGLGYLRQATSLAPDRADFWLDRAMTEWEVGRIREASESFQRLVSLEPSTLAYWGWGVCEFVMGKYANAARVLSQAVELVPHDAQIEWVASMARERAGMKPDGGEVASVANKASPSPDGFEFDLLAVPALVRQFDVERGAVTERLLKIFATACEGRVTREELAMLAPRCVLMAHQPWFGLDTTKIVAAGLERGVLVALFDDKFEPAPSLPWEIDGVNFRSVCHRGINLWQACRYEISLSLCKMPHAVEPDAPNDLRAIAGLYAYAMSAIDAAYRAMEFYQPEAVIVAQGYNVVSATLREIALRLGCRVIALENTFHRERLLWDDVSGIAVNQNLARNYFWRYCDQVNAAEANASVEAFLHRLATLKSLEHASPVNGGLLHPCQDLPTITYLAQVGLDSSVMFGLTGFGSQAEVIMALMRYAATRNVRLLIKLHPKESRPKAEIGALPPHFTAHSLETFPGYALLVDQLGERLVVDRDNVYNTYDWIKASEMCVTINSQAGLEAALLGKEVVLCGDAFYGALGFTHDAADAASLAFSLDRVLKEGVRRNDGLRCRKFFHIFTELYCIPKQEESVIALATAPARVGTSRAQVLCES